MSTIVASPSKKLDLDLIPKIKGLSKNSRTIITYTANEFNSYLQENNLPLNADSVLLYLSSLDGKASYNNSRRWAIKRLLRAHATSIQHLELIDTLFKTKIEDTGTTTVETAVQLDDYLTQQEVDQLVNYCKKRGTYRFRRLALIILGLNETGCRASELTNIRMRDIEPQNDHVGIKVLGKGNKERTVFMSRTVFDATTQLFRSKELLYQNERNGALSRNNLHRMIQLVGKNSGLSKARIHPHTFRHSCAMRLKQKGLDPKEIAAYLGHSSVSVTLTYYFHSKPTPESVLGSSDTVN